MEKITEEVIKVNFSELENIFFPINKKIGLTVFFNDVKYEFILNLKETDKLLILGSGALGFKKFDRTRPYLERHSWEFEYSTIYYNDPTYYVSNAITGGWGIGTENDYYLENISKILKIILKKLNILNENVVLYGSSAGGFTSLLLSIFIKGSTVFADIPQLYIYNYKSKDEELETWLDVKEHCFSQMSKDEFIERYKCRLNFIEMIKKENYVPNAFLRLDCSVDLDFHTQYVPFFRDLFQTSFSDINNIKLIIDWKNKGHTPLNKEETQDMIKKIFSLNTNQKDLLTYNVTDIFQANMPIPFENLKKYNTSRIDLKFEGDNNSLEILSINGSPKITHPPWLNDSTGPGLIIMNDTNVMNIKIKCLGNGRLTFRFRAMDIKDLNGKRIPIYINYTKIKVNDEDIIKQDTPTWHDSPIIFNKDIINEEIINLEIEFLPY